MVDTPNEQILAGIEELRREVQDLRRLQATRLESEINNARLAAIIESSDDAIIGLALDGRIMTWNEGATRIFGFSPDEIVGKSIYTIVPSERIEEETRLLERLARGERIEHLQTIRCAKGGRRIDISLTISPIRDSTGTIVGASKIARDITRQKAAEEELSRAKERAERANREKDHFIAVLSHELRTPLTPVLAGLSLLEEQRLSEQERHAEVTAMRRNIELESQLIDDLLEHTRITRGKIQLHRSDADIHQLIRAVLAMLDAEIKAKQLRVVLRLDAGACVGFVDSKRIQQVFWNLLRNAVKFTPKGGEITVGSRNEGGSGESSRLSVDFVDTGIGISPDVIQRIFNPFEQADHTITRRFGGLGLGLSISRTFVQMHSGTLTASSSGYGKGATFTVTLPGMRTNHDAAGNDAAMPRIGLSVLLVEDHADTRRVLARVLRERGYRIELAGTVAEAIGQMAHGHFDVLVSDIGLPDGTGMQVMEAARQQHLERGIAVSGFGTSADERASRRAGFRLHMAKPIDIEQLDAAIREVAREKATH